MRRGMLMQLMPMRRIELLITTAGLAHFSPVMVTRRFNFDAKSILSKEDHKLVPYVCGSDPDGRKTTEDRHGGDKAVSSFDIPSTHDDINNDAKNTLRQGVSAVSSSSPTRYVPWEICAMLLPLIPVGGSTIPIREVIHLLPAAAREEMQRDGDSPLAYVRRHFSDVIVVKGTLLSRRTVVLDNTPSNGVARQTLAPPPPPITTGHTAANRPSQNMGGTRTVLEVLDTLVEYIPTFFVQHQMVADQLPSDVTKQYADSSFLFYLKRFRHYIDIRAHHGNTEIRLRPDFAHPKRGEADIRYTSSLSGNDMLSQLARGRRPPRNSEANLIYFILPRMPTAYTPIATVLQDVSDIVSRHPSFDSRLGVTGLFEKYPEYFQIVDAKLRVRPFRSAPNSLDDLNVTTSPLPTIYTKVKKFVDEYAEGKDYNIETEKAAAVVPTGKLYALLTNEEKQEVKMRCRSFPRFLRLHGEEIVVSVDNMKVYQFRPTYEKCAETILDQRLTMSSLSPDDPVLKIPAAMEDSTSADWAVRELYDALPLMQCAELDEVMSLVPPSVKNALPQEVEKLVEHLALYPDYFLTWPYPDDPNIIVVQRAKLELMPMEHDTIAQMVMQLIPQGGIEASRLLRRVPLPLQRYFYRYGLKKVLGEMTKYFLVVGEKVMRIG